MFCDAELVLSDKTKGDTFNVLYATWPATKVGQRLYKFAVILNPHSNNGIYIFNREILLSASDNYCLGLYFNFLASSYF